MLDFVKGVTNSFMSNTTTNQEISKFLHLYTYKRIEYKKDIVLEYYTYLFD